MSQNTVGGRNAGGSDITEGPGGTVQQINRIPKATIIGSKYLNQEWLKGDIEYINGYKMEGVLLRYDVEGGIVEQYENDGKHKINHDSKLKKVVMYSANSHLYQILLNGGDYKLNDVPLIELVGSEELVGQYNIITRYSIKKSKASYNHVLDAGSEESKITIEATIYLAENHILTELPRSKKKVVSMFGNSNQELISSYIKSNQINVKKYQDLVNLFVYVNSLDDD